MGEEGVGVINFKKADSEHQTIIFKWLEEPHVKEFWDNSQAHKDDIVNFINGRKEPSNYYNGEFTYWVGSLDGHPFSLIMSIKENPHENRPQIKEKYLSKTGNTYGLDYMIGDKEYFGKGFGASTLKEFTEFFQRENDPLADTFFIDPDKSNPRAKHVYEKAGFKCVGSFIIEGSSVFKNSETYLLVKKL